MTTTARRLGGGGAEIRKPTAAQQRQRLEQRFQDIARSFVDLQPAVAGAEPEQVIVLETIAKSVDGLAKAAARIPGLEWLAERDLEDSDPADGFADAEHPEKKLGRRLYALFSNQRAMQQLLTLWQGWATRPEERARRNFGPFKELFIYLKDIRRWGVKDRLADTGVLEYWEENLTLGRPAMLSEVELWPHQDEGRRARAYEQLRALVEQSGGRCLAQTSIPEISYHGILVELPSAAVRDTVNRLLEEADTQLIRCDEVMFFRGVAQARFARQEGLPGTPLRDRLRDEPLPAGDPIVALLDGLPLSQHVALVGRALAYIENGECILVSRNLNHFKSFESLKKSLDKLPVQNVILDGEIVCLDTHGVSQFNELFSRRGKPVFYAFDLLWLDGQDFRGLPLIERKQSLRELIQMSRCERLIYAQHIETQGIAFFDEICARDLEGVVAKRKLSIYKSNSTGWLKVKNPKYSQAVGRHDLFNARGPERKK